MADKAVTHIKDLIPDPANLRKHGERNIALIEQSLEKVGAARSIVIDENNKVLAGNGVLEAAGNIGMEGVRIIEADGQELIAVRRRGLTEAQKTALAIADNRTGELSEWAVPALLALPREETAPWFSDKALELLAGTAAAPGMTAEEGRRSLAERFVVPPFSILDARQGYWQERKRAWIALGIKGELGRGNESGAMLDSKEFASPLERKRKVYDASPGKHARPEMNYFREGKQKRGDGHGRPTDAK